VHLSRRQRKNPGTIDNIEISAEWHLKSDENSWCLFAEFFERLRGGNSKEVEGGVSSATHPVSQPIYKSQVHILS